jgi:hypothetical protein
MERLRTNFSAASRHARTGDREAGYAILRHGLYEARIPLAPAPWTEALVDRYLQVIEAFQQRYGGLPF